MWASITVDRACPSAEFPLSTTMSSCAQESNLPCLWSHAVSTATFESSFPGIKKNKNKNNFIAIMLYLLHVDRPWSRAAPTPCTMLLNHSWKMLGSALAGEGLGKKCLFELSPICPKAIKPAHVPKISHKVPVWDVWGVLQCLGDSSVPVSAAWAIPILEFQHAISPRVALFQRVAKLQISPSKSQSCALHQAIKLSNKYHFVVNEPPFPLLF